MLKWAGEFLPAVLTLRLNWFRTVCRTVMYFHVFDILFLSVTPPPTTGLITSRHELRLRNVESGTSTQR